MPNWSYRKTASSRNSVACIRKRRIRVPNRAVRLSAKVAIAHNYIPTLHLPRWSIVWTYMWDRSCRNWKTKVYTTIQSSSSPATTALTWKVEPILISSTAMVSTVVTNATCMKVVSVYRWSFHGRDIYSRERKRISCVRSGMCCPHSKRSSIQKLNRKRWTV